MKNYLFLVFLFLPHFLSAQTVDDIIRKYDQAIGGADARKKIKTLKMTGNIEQLGFKLPITKYIINGKAIRTELKYNEMNIIQVQQDTSGWYINPLMGATSAVRMSSVEIFSLQKQSDLSDELADYKILGNEAELLGKENVEGIDCYKIKLTQKDGIVVFYFIGTEDYLLIKTSTTKIGEPESQTFYSNYKDVSGVLMAFDQMTMYNGQVYSQTNYDKIEANVFIDNSIFLMPK